MVFIETTLHPKMGRLAIGYVDDDPAKEGAMVMGLPMLGSGDDIQRDKRTARCNTAEILDWCLWILLRSGACSAKAAAIDCVWYDICCT